MIYDSIREQSELTGGLGLTSTIKLHIELSGVSFIDQGDWVRTHSSFSQAGILVGVERLGSTHTRRSLEGGCQATCNSGLPSRRMGKWNRSGRPSRDNAPKD